MRSLFGFACAFAPDHETALGTEAAPTLERLEPGRSRSPPEVRERAIRIVAIRHGCMAPLRSMPAAVCRVQAWQDVLLCRLRCRPAS